MSVPISAVSGLAGCRFSARVAPWSKARPPRRSSEIVVPLVGPRCPIRNNLPSLSVSAAEGGSGAHSLKSSAGAACGGHSGNVLGDGVVPPIGSFIEVSTVSGKVAVEGVTPTIDFSIEVSASAGNVLGEGVVPTIGFSIEVSTVAGNVPVEGVVHTSGFSIEVSIAAGNVLGEGVVPTSGSSIEVGPVAGNVLGDGSGVEGLGPNLSKESTTDTMDLTVSRSML